MGSEFINCNNTELFPYQKIGAEWLSNRQCALLADEMGLGKSIQSIKACDKLQAKRILIICPAIARINWLREFEKFSAEKRDFLVVEKRLTEWPINQSIIASFDTAQDVENTGNFDVLIIDEVHFLKSINAKRTKSIFGRNGLVFKAKRIWALSGTPAPNHAGDLWPLLYTFGATKLKYDDFINKFCDTYTDAKFGLRITGTKRRNIPELKTLLKDVMLRRLKVNVMKELPPIYYHHKFLEAGFVDLEIQDTFVQYVYPIDRRNELDVILRNEDLILKTMLDSFGENPSKSFKALEALAPTMSALRRYTGLQKTEQFIKLIRSELERNAYHKIVIFAIHHDVIRTIREGLRGYCPVTLYGGTPPSKRQNNLDRFKNRKDCRAIICNIQAAGTAINLTNAHHVAFIEQDWVPANNAQAVMRCHRIGQTEPVTVRFFGLANSIDEKITKILEKKTTELTEIFDKDEFEAMQRSF